MQFIGIAHDRPSLLGDDRDGLGVEGRGTVEHLGSQRPAHLHGAGPALFERGVVEIAVRVRVQDFMAERRRFGGLRGDCFQCSRLNPFDDLPQSDEIHCLVKTVVDRLANVGVVRNANFPGEILGASGLIGEDRSQQIIGPHSLDRRGRLASAAEARNGQGARDVPAPTRSEHRRIEQSLGERLIERGAADELEHQLQREGVLFGK